MADALGSQSIIISMMSSQVTRFEELKNQYMADPYFNQIVRELQRSKAVKKLPTGCMMVIFSKATNCAF